MHGYFCLSKAAYHINSIPLVEYIISVFLLPQPFNYHGDECFYDPILIYKDQLPTLQVEHPTQF